MGLFKNIFLDCTHDVKKWKYIIIIDVLRIIWYQERLKDITI